MSTPTDTEEREIQARQKAIAAGAHRAYDALLAAKKTGNREKILAAREAFMRSMVGTRATFETELEGKGR
jgi:hypothetical protein